MFHPKVCEITGWEILLKKRQKIYHRHEKKDTVKTKTKPENQNKIIQN